MIIKTKDEYNRVMKKYELLEERIERKKKYGSIYSHLEELQENLRNAMMDYNYRNTHYTGGHGYGKKK